MTNYFTNVSKCVRSINDLGAQFEFGKQFNLIQNSKLFETTKLLIFGDEFDSIKKYALLIKSYSKDQETRFQFQSQLECKKRCVINT